MKLAIFDFDRTLFPKDTIPYLMKKWYKLKYSRYKVISIYLLLLPFYITYKLGIGGKSTKDRLRLIAINGFNKLFKGMTKGKIEEFFNITGQIILSELNAEVLDELVRAQEEGFHTVIISGAYSPLLTHIGNNLDVDTTVGTDLVYLDNDIYDYKTGINVLKGEDKAKLIKNLYKESNIDWDNSYAYTDSIRDLDLLKLVGNPVVVNPEKELYEIAVNSSWTII